jgi:hypothetical protein
MSADDFLFWSNIEMVGVFMLVLMWFEVVQKAKRP